MERAPALLCQGKNACGGAAPPANGRRTSLGRDDIRLGHSGSERLKAATLLAHSAPGALGLITDNDVMPSDSLRRGPRNNALRFLHGSTAFCRRRSKRPKVQVS